MKHSPCGGCPPCCAECVFSPKNEAIIGVPKIVVTKADYACVKGFDDVVVTDGTLGQMRSGRFHPVTLAGTAFLRLKGNTLARHTLTHS